MPKLIYAAAVTLALVLPARAQTVQGKTPGVWHPAAGIEEVPLWPADAAIAKPELDGPEAISVQGKVAGRPWTALWNIARPSMAIYPAKGRNSGAAVMVYPGGGYQVLAIDLEGTEVCDRLTARGVTCVVVKYRVPQTWWPKDGSGQRAPAIQMALQDAQRALGLLRQRAAGLGVDPHRIGVLGFSAGGHLVAAVSNAPALAYAAMDAADRENVRPDFAVALYPGHLWSGEGAGKGIDLYPFDPIRADAPPTFLLHAQNDRTDDVRHSIAYFLALSAVKVPVEMHIYAEGGHAFGPRETDMPITRWPELVERWLRAIGMLR